MVSTVFLLHFLALAPAVIGVAIDSKCEKRFDPGSITYREVGARNTIEWRMWLEKDGDPISFWHDVPLYPNAEDKSIINMYTEIPRWTDGKIETNRDEPLNPIFHDQKNDKPRFVHSIWPHKTYPFNYGSIPQTWEDNTIEHPFTGMKGDNDPVDIIDISELKPRAVGEIRAVKVLGGIAMIDDNTTDWKVIAIDLEDPLAKLVKNVDDLEMYRPGLKQSFYDWFVYYKVVKGDGINEMFGGKYQTAELVMGIIEESHVYWQNLVKGNTNPGTISTNQTSQPELRRSYVPSKKATKQFNIPKKSKILPAATKPAEYNQWYYLNDKFELIVLPSQ